MTKMERPPGLPFGRADFWDSKVEKGFLFYLR
jgi:hypothetical protein